MSVAPGDYSDRGRPDSTDVLVISDLHLGDEGVNGTTCPVNSLEAAETVNRYARTADIDYVIDLGDSLKGPEAQEFLGAIEYPIDIVIGDENPSI